DTFIVNAKFLGLLKTIAGAERLISIEQAIEEAPRDGPRRPGAGVPTVSAGSGSSKTPEEPARDWSKICFYVTPIGDPESEQRRHADLFLSALVEPAMAEFGLKVVRADQIGKPGMITAQVLEH